MNSKKSNMKDVANLAGVSIATVSRYLNNNLDRMSVQTASRVKDAIEKLNYVPNAAARQLITNKSKIIAVIVVNISDYYSTEIFKGITSILKNKGYTTVLLDTNSDQQTEKTLINSVGTSTFDGLILQPLSSDVETIKNEILEKKPLVTLDRKLKFSPWPQVITNNYEISHFAANYFKNNKFKKVIILTSPIAIASTRKDRLKGVEDVFGSKNITVIEIDEHYYNYAEIYQKIINNIKKNNCPTLIFSLKERWLLEFLPSLIRDDIFNDSSVEISGFADTNIISAIYPKAKLIYQNPYKIGQIAAINILKVIHKKEVSELTIIESNFN